MKRSNTRRRLARAVAFTVATVCMAVVTASPAYAAPTPEPNPTDRLNTILGNATTWLVGILAAVATLFLTVGGVRYVMAGGDPGEIEKAKGAFKSAGIGYALAALAPIVVAILKGILGI
ncbi:pilin [Micromonospora globbae]|uniref:pilin n=1 Tax=Micromonospora globbae TaxID=1894969 RepID=UPI0034411F7F